MRAAQAAGKPVVIDFIGHKAPAIAQEQVYFVHTLDGAATLAVDLARFAESQPPAAESLAFAPGQRYLRGVFSGGTLAYEAQLILRDFALDVYANAPLEKRFQLPKATESKGHTIVDLGEDEFTVGRLHPMLDNDLRVKRILQEAADPETAVLLLDVVLGHGAHPGPGRRAGARARPGPPARRRPGTHPRRDRRGRGHRCRPATIRPPDGAAHGRRRPGRDQQRGRRPPRRRYRPAAQSQLQACRRWTWRR